MIWLFSGTLGFIIWLAGAFIAWDFHLFHDRQPGRYLRARKAALNWPYRMGKLVVNEVRMFVGLLRQ